MQENKHTPFEALVTILFIFAAFTFIVYKYGQNKNTIVNNVEATSTLSADDRENLKNQGGELYAQYLDKIFTSVDKGEKIDSDKLASDYSTDLQKTLTVPDPGVEIKNLKSSYTKADQINYLNTLDSYFIDLQKKTGGEENKIFQAQITPDGNILPLSDYDKDTLRLVQTEYQDYADKIIALETPIIYHKKAVALATDAEKIVYILNKIIENKDDKIYQLWISKYLETVFDIIATRI